MKKVLVTGATGFIGKHLVSELSSQNAEVISLVRKRNASNFSDRVRTVLCDMADYDDLPDIIADRDIDTVYHFAWQGVSDMDARDADIQLNNVRATLALLQSAHKMGVKTFIGAGSLHEAEGIQEMRENKVITHLGHMYKAAKTCAHLMAKAQAGAQGIRFFWPIITNTYGEGEHSGRLINTVVRKILANESPALSEGEQLYDFIHISDAVHALYLIGKLGIDGTNYILGSGEAKPLKVFMQEVGDITNNKRGGIPTPLGFGQIQSNVTFLPIEAFSTQTLTRDTGFTPSVTFREGIQRTVDWLMANTSIN